MCPPKRNLLGLAVGVFLFSLWWYAMISLLVAPWPGTPRYDALHRMHSPASATKGPAADTIQLDISSNINPLDYFYHSSTSIQSASVEAGADRESVQTREKEYDPWRATYEWKLIVNDTSN